VFKFNVKTQQHYTNISILMWQHVSVLLDHLQANIQRYEVQSVHVMYYAILYKLQGIYIYTHTHKRAHTHTQYIYI